MDVLKKTLSIVTIFLFLLLLGLNANATTITSPPREMPNHDQSELDNPKDEYYCGPVAAWNSIEWLYDTYPAFFKDKKPADWKDGVDEIAGYMKTDQTKGTWVNDFIEGKKEFFKKHGKQNSWVVESKDADWDPDTQKWNTDQISWKWIKDQMDKGQDVEVVIRWKDGAHWTSPAKGIFEDDPGTANILTFDYYVWNDLNDNDLFDLSDTMEWYLSDPHQAITSMAMSLGTSPIAAGNNWINGLYGEKNVWVTAVVAESPIPEPATMFLFGFGLLFAAKVSRRKNNIELV